MAKSEEIIDLDSSYSFRGINQEGNKFRQHITSKISIHSSTDEIIDMAYLTYPCLSENTYYEETFAINIKKRFIKTLAKWLNVSLLVSPERLLKYPGDFFYSIVSNKDYISLTNQGAMLLGDNSLGSDQAFVAEKKSTYIEIPFSEINSYIRGNKTLLLKITYDIEDKKVAIYFKIKEIAFHKKEGLSFTDRGPMLIFDGANFKISRIKVKMKGTSKAAVRIFTKDVNDVLFEKEFLPLNPSLNLYVKQ